MRKDFDNPLNKFFTNRNSPKNKQEKPEKKINEELFNYYYNNNDSFINNKSNININFDKDLFLNKKSEKLELPKIENFRKSNSYRKPILIENDTAIRYLSSFVNDLVKKNEIINSIKNLYKEE